MQGSFFDTPFNANDVPQDQFDDSPLPAGDYQVAILEAVEEANARSEGSHIKLDLVVVNGPMANRHVWARLNVRNPNETAQRIAQAQFASILHAVGVPQINSAAELARLINKQVVVRVKVKTDPQYGPRNEVGGFKPVQEHGGQQQAAAAPWTAQTQPAPAQQPAQPWAQPPAQPAYGAQQGAAQQPPQPQAWAAHTPPQAPAQAAQPPASNGAPPWARGA